MAYVCNYYGHLDLKITVINGSIHFLRTFKIRNDSNYGGIVVQIIHTLNAAFDDALQQLFLSQQLQPFISF